MPKQISELKEFLNILKKLKEVEVKVEVEIKNNKDETKFRFRSLRYLYTYVEPDSKKARKIEETLKKEKISGVKKAGSKKTDA